jgi:hypothetical protein
LNPASAAVGDPAAPGAAAGDEKTPAALRRAD